MLLLLIEHLTLVFYSKNMNGKFTYGFFPARLSLVVNPISDMSADPVIVLWPYSLCIFLAVISSVITSALSWTVRVSAARVVLLPCLLSLQSWIYRFISVRCIRMSVEHRKLSHLGRISADFVPSDHLKWCFKFSWRMESRHSLFSVKRNWNYPPPFEKPRKKSVLLKKIVSNIEDFFNLFIVWTIEYADSETGRSKDDIFTTVISLINELTWFRMNCKL